MVVYIFGSFGIVNLTIFITVMSILPGFTQKAMLENQAATSGLLASPTSIFVLPLLTAAACLIPSLILSVRWAMEIWDRPLTRSGIKMWPMVFGLLALLLLLTGMFLAFGKLSPFDFPFDLSSAIFSVVIGSLYCAVVVVVWLAVIAILSWMLRKTLQSKRVPAPPPVFKPYNPFDYLAAALAQGILCATLSTVLTIAYALSLVLIAIVDIPHLTLSGTVTSTAHEQVAVYYTTAGAYNLWLLLAASAVALVIVIIGNASGLLRSQPPKLAEVSNLGDE
jgi:hypothetical protein